MTARMDNSFINFVDFIDVVLEAYHTAPKKLFEKTMRMMISTFHTQEIELDKLSLAIDDMNIIPVEDLDEFYDTLLDAIDDIKLPKRKIEPLITKDVLFAELGTQMERLHGALIHYMDRMGQLEVRLLQSA